MVERAFEAGKSRLRIEQRSFDLGTVQFDARHPSTVEPSQRDHGHAGLVGGDKDAVFGTKRRQGMVETMAKQTARTVGSQVGRQILRGLLGGIFGGKR